VTTTFPVVKLAVWAKSPFRMRSRALLSPCGHLADSEHINQFTLIASLIPDCLYM